ncbi:cytochrome P450 [Mycena haematopus]|nr:cytochrome P450 [Mycena haematopus]
MTLFLVVIFLAGAWILWNIIRFSSRKSPLDNVRGPPPQSIWIGNFGSLFDTNGWSFHAHIAQTYGRIVRIDGPMRSKILYVFDPLALHHIIVKVLYSIFYLTSDVSHRYSRTSQYTPETRQTYCEQHQRQRKMLNPAFSNVHLRRLAPVFYDVARKLRTGLASKVANGPEEVDILHWLSRCALELIGQGGLGYSFDNLGDNSGNDQPVHPYSEALSGIQPLIIQLSLAFRLILPWASKIGTPRFQRTVVDWVPWKALHDFRDTLDIMDHTTRQIFEAKKNALSSTGEWSATDGGKDIISILMQVNVQAEDGDRLPDAEVLGQMTTLIFAATETTATSLARILYLLAQNPDVQDRLRDELSQAKQQDAGDINYDQLMQLPYLDAVCRETLRLHPPTPFNLRTTLVDAVLPLATPLRGCDGADINALHVPRGTDIMLSIQNANCDTGVWGSDAAEWKPARWLAPLPETVTSAPATGVYQHLLTFSGGPRACIGFRFSQLEMKVVLAVLLPEFQVSLGKQQVDWTLGFIAQPSVEGKQQLPLVLSLL